MKLKDRQGIDMIKYTEIKVGDKVRLEKDYPGYHEKGTILTVTKVMATPSVEVVDDEGTTAAFVYNDGAKWLTKIEEGENNG